MKVLLLNIESKIIQINEITQTYSQTKWKENLVSS